MSFSKVSVALVLLMSSPAAQACSVCFSMSDENRQAYLNTTIFLTFFPLSMICGGAYWVRKRMQEIDALPSE